MSNIFRDPNESSSEEDPSEDVAVSSDEEDHPEIPSEENVLINGSGEENGSFGSDSKQEVYKGRLDDDFTITKSLGHGSFGQIFQCKHKIDGNEYAVKRMYAENDGKTPIEIKALSQLHHKNIIRYHQVWKEPYYSTGYTDKSTSEDNSSNKQGSEDNSVTVDHSSTSEDNSSNNQDRYYIQMEFCSSTVARVWDKKEMDIERAWDLLVQLAEGIQHIHQEGYIHCDISPANILINHKDELKICDFGLARFNNGKEDQTISVLVLDPSDLANPIYRAPELLQAGGVITEKVDIYSLGVVAVDLFYFSDSEKCRKREDFVKNKKLPDCFECEDPEIENLLFGMIDDEPNSRPSAKEVVRVLVSKKKKT